MACIKLYKCIVYHIVETFRKCNVSEFCENSVAAKQNKCRNLMKGNREIRIDHCRME